MGANVQNSQPQEGQRRVLDHAGYECDYLADLDLEKNLRSSRCAVGLKWRVRFGAESSENVAPCHRP